MSDLKIEVSALIYIIAKNPGLKAAKLKVDFLHNLARYGQTDNRIVFRICYIGLIYGYFSCGIFDVMQCNAYVQTKCLSKSPATPRGRRGRTMRTVKELPNNATCRTRHAARTFRIEKCIHSYIDFSSR